jgi:hypothetical protein
MNKVSMNLKESILPDKIEELSQTINDLDMGEGMSIHYSFTGLPPIEIVSKSLPPLHLISISTRLAC